MVFGGNAGSTNAYWMVTRTTQYATSAITRCRALISLGATISSLRPHTRAAAGPDAPGRRRVNTFALYRSYVLACGVPRIFVQERAGFDVAQSSITARDEEMCRAI